MSLLDFTPEPSLKGPDNDMSETTNTQEKDNTTPATVVDD